MIANRHQEEELYRTDQLQSLTKFTVINIKYTITQNKQLSPWKKHLFSDFSENCLQFKLFAYFTLKIIYYGKVPRTLLYTKIRNF